MKSFFAELKRRNVYRAAVGYAAVAWLLMQVATQTLPFFDTPAWAVRVIIVVLLGGFPFAMIWAWVFEWTPKGIVRTNEVPPGLITIVLAFQPIGPESSRRPAASTKRSRSTASRTGRI